MRSGRTPQGQVALRALISFFTVYPVGGASLHRAASSVYLLPLIGALAAAPGSLVLLMSGYALPAGVAASLGLAAALLAAGLHHTDGLLDVGDALMVRGSAERRREVMKDLQVGAGGFGALIVIYAPAFAALSAIVADSPLLAAAALLAAETASRSAMVFLLAFGKPAETSSSSRPFIEAMRGGARRYSGLALAVVLPVLLAAPLGVASFFALLWLPVAAGALFVAGRVFGGVGGDVSGAAGETARAVVLVAFSAGVAG